MITIPTVRSPRETCGARSQREASPQHGVCRRFSTAQDPPARGFRFWANCRLLPGLILFGQRLPIDIRKRQRLDPKQFHAKCSVALIPALFMYAPELVCVDSE
jgi:hypothetical protein